MTKKSDEFEIMVSRIHEMLAEEGAVVEWNKKIPDPDNPEQLRQIDVLIKKDDTITLVECRDHRKPQNVKWIEELVGRQISLKANAIIAVSSAGFTSGAIKKANEHSVILKDMSSLTDEEIRLWARSIDVSIFFYVYERFKLILYFDSLDLKKVDTSKLPQELRNFRGFNSLFTSQLDLLDSKKLIVKENRNKKIKFKTRFYIEDFHLCGSEIKLVHAEGLARLEELKLKVPEVLAYGEPSIEHYKRNVYVQKFDSEKIRRFNFGETSIVHHDGRISIQIDLSKLEIPPYWQFNFVTIDSLQENYIDTFAVINSEKIVMNVDKLELGITSFDIKYIKEIVNWGSEV